MSACFLFSFQGFAYQSFQVKHIRVEGLTGISTATVLSYMPVKTGHVLHSSDTPKIISALYNTGFFSDVSLSQEGNTLVVHAVELPLIGSIKVEGNSIITKDEINNVLKELGLVKGQVLNPSILSEVTKSLRGAYDLQGHYNATVKTDVTPLSQGRVNIVIHISEGRVALVEKIRILGNTHFSESTLIDTLKLTTWQWDSFITHDDHYTRDGLSQSLDNLSNFYLNRGYLKFKIDSAHAVLNPDRKAVDVIIHVTENNQYTLSSITVTGVFIVPEKTILNLPEIKTLKTGDVFSKEKMLAASKAITYVLGDKGYAFAKVNIKPVMNDATKTVAVSFQIIPGRKVYIRQINFKGNTASSDSVLRNSMRQSEGSLSSIKNSDESVRQLNLLGYFKNVTEKTVPVPTSQNQVDLDYAVTEQPSAQATVGAGYGTDGVVLSAGVNEKNFLGTGRQVGVNFARNVYQQSYSFSYNNPYYTPQGVQRGFNLYNTKTTPGELNIAPYEFTMYGGNMTYSIPFSEKDSYQVGVGLQRTVLEQGFNPASQITQFAQNEGTTFNQLLLTLGWTRNGLDRLNFPTEGTYQNLGIQVSAPLSGPSLEYYKATYQIHDYQPITHGFIGFLAATAGYGNGYGKTQGLPFFTNYYAGGLVTSGEVRGYQTNTLGPRGSTGYPMGGNALITGTAQVILPGPLSGDNFRTSVFMDGGNVYNTWNVYNTYSANQVGIKPANLRYSTGLDLQWRLPVLNAILEVALSKALNPQPGDLVEPFSFNIGGNF